MFVKFLAFRQDICEAPLNNFGENVVASSSVALLDTSPPENHLNAQRFVFFECDIDLNISTFDNVFL